jgi:hypothetical protein
MNSKSIITWLLIVIIAVVLAGMLLPISSRPIVGRPSKAKLQIAELVIALKNYESAFGVYPTGENSNIVSVLAGDNAKKIVFLNFRRIMEHPNEMVDPWGTPYRIEFFQQTNFIIRSAGKDKIFGDADDFIFNSVSNDFVKP